MRHISRRKLGGILILLIALMLPLSWYCAKRKTDDAPKIPTQPEVASSSEENQVFYAFDKRPEPEGGMTSIINALKIPEEAKNAGIEGTVMIQVVIDEQGVIVQEKVIKSLGYGCDEAAIEAIKSVQWRAALKDDIPVKCQIAIPVVFNLFKLAYDEQPEPIGGWDAIISNLRYPEKAKNAGLRGVVSLTVTVDENGNAVDATVRKSFDDEECNQAAIEAVKATKWKPGLKDGKPVRGKRVYPVVFSLIDETKTQPKEEPQRPGPIGGMAAIQRNLIYPESARSAGIEGSVLLRITIGENGTITETEIVEGLGHAECDEAAIQAVKATKWQPYLHEGVPSQVRMTIPVIFKLNDDNTPNNEPQYSEEFDTRPEPIGGMKVIQQNLVYPAEAKEAEIEGTVMVQVIINDKGEVTNTWVVKSMNNKECDDAAVAAVKATRWKPATKDGKPVAVRIHVPVIFRLNNI